MTHKPPIPPANRNPHDSTSTRPDPGPQGQKVPENLREQDRQGNIHQNVDKGLHARSGDR